MKGRVRKMSEAERNLPASSGTTMPSLGGEYGVTIWQWDENQQP